MKAVLLLFSAVLLIPWVDASTYRVDWEGVDRTTYHEDGWVFEYTPGKGWSSGALKWGDASSWNGPSFSVLADDGSIGQTVNLRVTINCRFSSYIWNANPYMTADPNWQVKTANFAGLDSGELLSTLSVSIRAPVCSVGPTMLTGSFLDDEAFDITVTAPATVGVYENPLCLLLTHASIVPTNPRVFDPSQPAGFGAYVEVDVKTATIEVVEVPDEVSTLMLLLCVSFLCLPMLRRKAFRPGSALEPVGAASRDPES